MIALTRVSDLIYLRGGYDEIKKNDGTSVGVIININSM